MRKKTVYMVGIKGVAMTALAVYLTQKGYRVEGSDIDEEFLTDKVLAQYHIPVKSGFKKSNVDKKYDFIVVTGAHGGMTNPEAQYAKTIGIPTFMHGEVLGHFMEKQEGISVAGCHGKSTTSALIASLLTHASLCPSYAVGTAGINDLGPAGHFGSGKYFIAEADEYMTCPLTCKTPRFLWQKPKIMVVTNIEYDHPDAYRDIEDIKKAFIRFSDNLPNDGILICCIDDKNIAQILPFVKKQVITYGFSPRAEYKIARGYFGEGISFMRIKRKDIDLGEYMLSVPGKHNLLNALAASIVADLVGVDWVKIKDYLKLFTGTRRRFEKIATVGKIQLFDDYAHHPSEIKATISGAREWFPNNRLIVIFQPHTYSRTKSLFMEFSKAFGEADMVILTDIYPSARESYDPSISSKMLEIEANKYKKNVYYKKDKQEVVTFLRKQITSQDIVITMGAGDIYTWHKDIIGLLHTLC